MNTTPDLLPPHDLNAERAALGCALQDAGLAAELRPDWFYDLRHRRAAETLQAMAAARQPIDAATAYQAMTAADIPEALSLVIAFNDACPSAANFCYWRDILAEKLTLRRIIQTAQTAIADAYEAGRDSSRKPLDCLDDFERAALFVRQQSFVGNPGEVDVKGALLELTDDYETAKQNGRPRGLATGFTALDRLLGGLKPQQLIIIAARPAVGKTSLALGIAEQMALVDRVPVGFFSLEMSGKELLHRLACSRARVDGTRLHDGKPSEAEIKMMTAVTANLSRAPLHICDAGGLTIAQLTARARRMVQRHGIQALFVDYLGLLRSGEKGLKRYEETTLVSNALKALAKELNLPVIALAQLNRDTEKEGRAPRLSDLRDSGAIEQDGDVVALLHPDQEQPGDTQAVAVIIAKQRAGRTGKVELAFNRAITRFENKSVVG
jgi:replicative DNA helicase